MVIANPLEVCGGKSLLAVCAVSGGDFPPGLGFRLPAFRPHKLCNKLSQNVTHFAALSYTSYLEAFVLGLCQFHIKAFCHYL